MNSDLRQQKIEKVYCTFECRTLSDLFAFKMNIIIALKPGS